MRLRTCFAPVLLIASASTLATSCAPKERLRLSSPAPAAFKQEPRPKLSPAVVINNDEEGYRQHQRDKDEWGKPSQPALGAVVVFGREGGGHVGFLVGQSADNFYVLGGNQANCVSITPIAKNRALGFRWLASLPASVTALPAMSGWTVSRNEA
jgi:hypothetical protein